MERDKAKDFVIFALKKMFSIIGQEYSEEFCKQEDWFLKHTWTKEQRDFFKKWFVKEFMKRFKCLKLRAEKEFRYFDLNWGWKEEEKL